MDERARLLEFYADRLSQEDKDLVLPLVGAFSSGKSSLINALIGKPVLDVGADPTTSSIIEVRLSPSILLVDTPGMLSGKAEHQMALADYMANADAILMVVDVQPLLDKATTEGVKQFVEASRLSGRPIYGVLAKCESKSSAEIEQAKEYLRTQAGIDFADVVAVSAKTGWLDEFNSLLDNLQSKKNEIVDRAVEERVRAVARDMASDINALLRESASLGDLDDAIGRAQARLRSIYRNIDTLLADMAQKVQDDADEACREFKSIVATQLNGIVTTKGRNADQAVYEAANSTGAMVMETYQRRIIDDLLAMARQRQEKLDGVPMSALESMAFVEKCFNGFTYDIDLSEAGHENDKTIGKAVVMAAAVAAAIASWGSASPAVAGAAKGASATSKAMRLAKFALDVKTRADAMGIVSDKLGRRVGVKRGLVETSVGWVTEWHAKSVRLRAINDYIDESLLPQFRPQLLNAGQMIVRQASTLLRDEASAVTGSLERSLRDLRGAMAGHKDDYSERMAMYREYASQLSEMQIH